MQACAKHDLSIRAIFGLEKIMEDAKLALENSDVCSGGSIRCYHCTSFRP
jgi:hypothetical protein